MKKVTVLGLEHVGDRNEILVLVGKNGEGSALDFDDGFLGLAHGFSCATQPGLPILIPSNSRGLE